MKVLYVVSVADNTLYQGQFRLAGRYQTYGQQSFIYDFVSVAHRQGHEVELLVDAPEQFALVQPLRERCRIGDLRQLNEKARRSERVVLDVIAEEVWTTYDFSAPTVKIVHDALGAYPFDRCPFFVCLSESAYRYQKRSIPEGKLRMIHQGVDLRRFQPVPAGGRGARRPRILVYSRLEGRKKKTMMDVVRALLKQDVDLTVLGDGEGFWELSDECGEKITLVNYIPCQCIQNFLPGFDLVVSSARGVMEAMACGIPAISAGLGYGGPVTEAALPELIRTNITGFHSERSVDVLGEDVAQMLSTDGAQCRRLAERNFDMAHFVEKVIALSR
ncbi:MAG TPA: glycosyltransferase [Elusimicrobiota bacterium]|nr:glycosyltransferase [Elusimicrobiota bacterium]